MQSLLNPLFLSNPSHSILDFLISVILKPIIINIDILIPAILKAIILNWAILIVVYFHPVIII